MPIIIILTASSAQAEGLTEFRMKLKAERFRPISVTMSGTQSLVKLPNENWQFQLMADGSWAGIEETSEFSVQQNQVLPVHFQSDSHFSFFSEKKEITFDRQNNKISITVDKDQRTLDLKAAVFDPHSYQIHLANQIREGKSDIEFQVIRYKRPLIYSYQVVGEEWLNTATGKLLTVKVRQVRGVDKKEDYFVWLAKDYGYIPIQFEHYKKDKIIDRIEMISGTFDGKPIQGSR
ncbi:protease II [Gynuella sunshinyii YC6258]|uniref:Protease II n=2 Tax=Gynuella sunshinyii TaxID=1445505 RepID=A0A0C5VR64_9GAMM|nr:protease II [Gynuella sunshinyii YC6258]